MKYIVKTRNNPNGSAFFGQAFKNAIVEYVSGDENTETYEVTSEVELDRLLDLALDVIEYTKQD